MREQIEHRLVELEQGLEQLLQTSRQAEIQIHAHRGAIIEFRRLLEVEADTAQDQAS